VLVPVANEARDLTALIGCGGQAAWRSQWRAMHRQVRSRLLRATTGARFSLTNTAEKPVSQVGEKAPPHRPLLEGAALIVFTSGSTGRPKVVLSIAPSRENSKQSTACSDSRRTRGHCLSCKSLLFSGLWISLLTLLRGGTLLMHSRVEPMAISCRAEGAAHL